LFARGRGISKASRICLLAALLAWILNSSFLHVAYGVQPHSAVRSSFPEASKSLEVVSPHQNGSATHVEGGELYSDSLPPGSFRKYVIEAPERSLVSFFIQSDTEGDVLDVEAIGPLNRTRVSVVWLPEPYIYYVGGSSEVGFKVTNPSKNTTSYRFYVDVSQPLAENKSKAVPLKGGKAAFHVDLRKDDRVFLRVGPADGSPLRIWVFVLYYDILPEMTYMLRLHRKSLSEALYFSADFGRRYYIMVDSIEAYAEFSLAGSTYSPPWNQEWFWLAISFSFLITAISLADIERSRKLEKAALSALIGYFCWFSTIGLAFSVAGSFGYGTTVYEPLFYLLIISYTLSHALGIYGAHLDRKTTFLECPSCGAKVNVEEVNYCCGTIVIKVSEAWLVLPLSLSLLFFIVSYIAFERVSPQVISSSLWIASLGSLSGGIIAWWINRKVYPLQSWKRNPDRYFIPTYIRYVSFGLLAAGTLFSFLSPLLIGVLLESFTGQHVESFLPAHALWVRIRIAPLTLPIYVVLGSAISAVVLGYLVALKIRNILTRDVLGGKGST